MNIQERIKNVSSIAYDFDLNNYLQFKSLLVFLVNSNSKRCSILSGNDIDNILERANRTPVDAVAGYAVDAHEIFSTETPTDIFLISDNVLKSTTQHIDSIIIHELSHLLIDSKKQCKSLPSFVNDMAIKLYNATDIENSERTRHDLEFCQLLIYGCFNYQIKTRKFKTLQETVENAMKYDVFGSFPIIE